MRWVECLQCLTTQCFMSGLTNFFQESTQTTLVWHQVILVMLSIHDQAYTLVICYDNVDCSSKKMICNRWSKRFYRWKTSSPTRSKFFPCLESLFIGKTHRNVRYLFKPFRQSATEYSQVTHYLEMIISITYTFNLG